MNKSAPRYATILGWIAVGISISITCFWAFWGIIENFHEGWYFESLFANLGLMFVQYLSPMLIFMVVTLISIFWSRLGGILYAVFALVAIGFFRAFSNTAVFLIILPLFGLGLLYWFGRPKPRILAVLLTISLPIITLFIAGTKPVILAIQRVDDGNLGARLVQGNGVTLTWAPVGPGWPREGGNWDEANQACQYLNEDGSTLASAPQLIWRLATVEEAVRSMSLHGQNSGGVWDAAIGKAVYETTPDKESPLWDVHSQVIYWWTGTEAGDERAFMIVYDGKVWLRDKQFGPGYLGFRCVRDH